MSPFSRSRQSGATPFVGLRTGGRRQFVKNFSINWPQYCINPWAISGLR
jgi:hypothetical protein